MGGGEDVKRSDNKIHRPDGQRRLIQGLDINGRLVREAHTTGWSGGGGGGCS